MKNNINSEKTKINDMISDEHKKINMLENIENNINELNNSINKCLDLFSSSVQGKTSDNLINDLRNTEVDFRKESIIEISEEISNCYKEIDKYKNNIKSLEKEEEQNLTTKEKANQESNEY